MAVADVTPNLETRVGSLLFKNPVLSASGTFGYGLECRELFDPARLGGIVTKTVTIRPRAGNPPRRIVETPSGMLNSIGLENVGIDTLISKKLPELKTIDTRRIVSLAGERVTEIVTMAERLADHTEVDAIEINISCPNIERGGLEVSNDPETTSTLTREVKAVFPRSVWVKLSPEAPRIVEVARAAESAGADALVLFNSFQGMAIDVDARRPLIGRGLAGFTGPAIRPLSLARLFRLRAMVTLPVIGVGGIEAGRDAMEYLVAGASAVQVGTATFRSPTVLPRIIDEIEAILRRNGVAHLAEIIGSLVGGDE